MTRGPLVAMEDAIAEELVLAELGVAQRPRLAERYVIIAIRGRGARGLVCRALDERLDRIVALKLYPPIGDARIEAEIAREAKALARLDHPNVVRVHDVSFGTLELGSRSFETSFISMELIEGKNLRVWLASAARDSSVVYRVVRSIGAALVAAHARGIVHRDVKPENVMIDNDGAVRVVDFGLARSTESMRTPNEGSTVEGHDAVAEPLATSFGKLTGTLEYMAPEARDGVADARSDQFSFAVTAWECLSGVLPFDARTETYRDTRLRPFDGSDTLPTQFRRALERGMAEAPADRFSSVDALLHALEPRSAARLAGGAAMLALGLAAAAIAYSTSITGLVTSNGHDAASAADASVDSDGGNAVVAASHDASTDANRRMPDGADASMGMIDMGADAGQRTPSDEACRAAAGVWEVVTTVAESRVRSVPVGNRGYYTFGIRPSTGCEVEVFVVKLGDDTSAGQDAGVLYATDDVRDDRRRVRLGGTADAVTFDEVFGLASARRGRREYGFHVRIVGDALEGTFENPGSNGRLVQRGTLSGTRLPEGSTPFAELNWPSQGTSQESEP